MSRLRHGMAVDGRTYGARRYRELSMSFADDLGGADKLTEAQRTLVRQAATLHIQAERVQAAVLRGEAVDEEQLTRLSNALARVLAALKTRTKPASAPGQALADYLATAYPAAGPGEAAGDHLAVDDAVRPPREPNARQRPP